MAKNKRTLRGLRADNGNITQVDAAKKAGLSMPAYNAIEQFVDDPAMSKALEKLFGVKIEITVTDAE